MKIENLKHFSIFLAHFGNFKKKLNSGDLPQKQGILDRILFFQIFSRGWQHFITKRNH